MLKSLFVLLTLLFFTGNIKAEELRVVSFNDQNVEIIDQGAGLHGEHSLRLEIELEDTCAHQFRGLLPRGTNNYEVLATTEKPNCQGESSRVEVEVDLSIRTKSFPAREYLTLSGKRIWVESMFGEIQLERNSH